ncbi:hypothetical protein F0562_013808 [Nyssa sinensis]|uniref:AAA+ ATPase domain-containing protein n=1 Tax=Nyssa sinensis TaxID=561372 RepID=A0A5J4ZPG2_9ASTE|nr:hypothetical protein F0562_013808 [Nyssa sinensis]
MPPKTKKHSKAASKLSHTEQTASPRSSSSSTPPADLEMLRLTPEDVRYGFQSLLWLLLVLHPGSTVSVSLASSKKKFSSNLPLSSLADECARHLGVGSGDKMVNKMGNYFALATVFPSCKLLKNGVRLSSNLSYTLGCPSLGRIVFVYPIQCQSVTSKMLPHINFSAETTHDRFENGKVSSPKTPLFSQSKLSSPDTSQLISPRYEESVSNTPNPYGTLFDPFDIREVLEDESARKLLQTCTSSWLCYRSLLCGNIVTIPILSKLCIFQTLKQKYIYIHHWIPHRKLLQKKDLPCLELECEDTKVNVGNISKLGGLAKEYAVLKDIIISSSVKGTLSSLGLRPTKGVLLHGAPGTGKTSLAQLCAHDAGVNLFSLNGPEIFSQYYGESEQALNAVFDSASRAAPAVVFIDELDAIAPARKDGGEELSQRMVATLLNSMDGISRTDGLLVIAATNRPDSIEPALRRPGRLDREIEIGVPSPKQRYDILLVLLSEMEHSLSDMQVQHLAIGTHGFVGADLAALCNEAALVCLRRYVNFKKSCDDSESNRTSVVYDGCSTGTRETSNCSEDTKDLLSRDDLESTSSSFSYFPVSSKIQNGFNDRVNWTCLEEENILKVAFEDFERARMKVRPSAMREVILEVPKVKWEDVGGQKEVKTQLMEAVEWPQKHQDAFKRIGTRPPTGVLMFGPPGCSKTLLARAVASEAGLNFLAVKGPELFSKWVGESEKAVRSLFAKARENAPSIIFFDEIDGLAVIRGKESDGVSVADRVMSQLLIELDGRFDRLLYVGPPNEKDREDIFSIHLRKMPCANVCIKELALLTEGCTGADISLICREAAVAAIEESLDNSEITMEHLKTAIKQVQPSKVQSYQELSTKFQRLVCSSATKDELPCQPCSSRSNWIPFWTLIKYIVQVLHQLPAAFSQSWSSSNG